MRKKIAALVLGIGITATTLIGCTQNEMAKNFGGEMTITLEPGQKLENVTWKEDSFWYLTRPMREDETAEVHTFQQDSSWGVFEGTVTITEQDKK